MDELIEVRSHVGRDLLQSAQVFKTDRAVVWEYVANSLQYTAPGVPPRVVVSIDEKNRVITIADNGRGMNQAGLRQFFMMHGENPDRAAGRIGRGMFGTGKSAAFGVGDSLTVTSVSQGVRTKVRLERKAVEALKDGSPIPVEVLENERATGEPNGTIVEIGGIHLKRLDRDGVVGYIERHLAHYPRDAEVFVDHHKCEFIEPDIAEQYVFTPGFGEQAHLGSAQLIVKVSKAALPEELRGIQVFSHGNWHTTSLAGSENKPMTEFIFGDIEVPALEEYTGPIAPFDNTRSGQLNPANELVQALYRFIGPHIDSVRRDLVARERERARSEEARRLAEQAARIAEVLSADFAIFRAQLRAVQSAVTGRDLGRRYEPIGTEEEDRLVEGGPILAAPILGQDSGEGRATGSGQPAPDLPRPVERDDEGLTTGQPRGGEGRKPSPRGGLNVDYRNMGENERRGRYLVDSRTIVINLDHPQVAAGYRLGGADSAEFVRLASEIATAEYAIALASELVDTYTVADEAIFDIHTTIDRVSRRFVDLYRKVLLA